MSLLDDLLRASKIKPEEVTEAKSDLEATSNVELKGVNAPEFEEGITSAPQKGLRLPVHEDGLDDTPVDVHEAVVMEQSEMERAYEQSVTELAYEKPFGEDGNKSVFVSTTKEDGSVEMTTRPFEEPYTSYEIEVDEDEKDHQFGNLKFQTLCDTSRELTRRTTKALHQAGYYQMSDIKGLAHRDLLALKGFGRKGLTELHEVLGKYWDGEAWILKRKSKVSTEPVKKADAPESEANTQNPPQVAAQIFPNYFESEPVVEEAVTPEPVVEEAVTPEPVVEEAVTPEPVVEEAVTPEPVVSQPSPYSMETSATSPTSVKVLVIGGFTVAKSHLTITGFEEVYGPHIVEICNSAKVPSISMIDYAKGWSYLASTIRDSGWPKGVDVLCISKSFLSRPEVLLELRLQADIVIEN